jgi:hypothetical protein
LDRNRFVGEDAAVQIFGKKVDGVDLALTVLGGVLILAGLGAFAGFLVLKGMGGRLAFLAASLALIVIGVSMINTHVRKSNKPAIDG